ncbi:MAG: hypothetical protein HY774_03215 [Acidobacteria bacterium]|nr:hypothetical protein [Acidobacteriota bacterium]
MNPRSGWQARSPGCNPGKTLPLHPARPAAVDGGWPGGANLELTRIRWWRVQSDADHRLTWLHPNGDEDQPPLQPLTGITNY